MEIFNDGNLKEKLKENTIEIERLNSIFKDYFQSTQKMQETNKEETKKTVKKQESKLYQQINNHELHKFITNSPNFKGKLTLLDENQPINENESFQELMNLFLEENESINDVNFTKNDKNKYLITQLYTAFSLLSRNIYLNNDNDNNIEKSRIFLKYLNSIKYNNNEKNSKITNQVLEFINHNILKIEDFNNDKNNKDGDNINIKNVEQKNNSKILEITAKPIYKKQTSINSFLGNEINNNVIFNDEKEENSKIQVEDIYIGKTFNNYALDNEMYKEKKSYNLRKILGIDTQKLKEMPKEERDKLIKDIYQNGMRNNLKIFDNSLVSSINIDNNTIMKDSEENEGSDIENEVLLDLNSEDINYSNNNIGNDI